MKKSEWNWLKVVGLLISVFLMGGVASAAVQTKIYQCANYKAGTGDHNTCEQWINGNINEQKATLFEGDTVPYRLHLTGLNPGDSYTATIEWDATQGDKNALDYLKTVDATVANADPCDDLALSSGCNAALPDSSWPIAVDPEVEKGRDQVEGTADDITQETPHQFRAWNATITAVGGYHYDPDPWDYTSTTKIRVAITFEAAAGDVLLAWGAHISTRMDWDEAHSAINIAGSPYHMRLLTVIHDSDGDIVASGNRDLQLSASAVFFPITLTIEKSTDRDTSDWFSFTTNLADPDDAFDLQSSTESSETSNKTLIATTSPITVTEGDPGALWMLDNISCLDLSVEPPVAIGHTSINDAMGASLALAEGAIVKCTFHNVFIGEPLLVIEKKVIAADGSCGTVNFDDPTTNETLAIASGDSVKYCYRVKNSGVTAAYNITLNDDAGGLAPPFAVSLSGGHIADLDGGGQLNDLDIDSHTFGEAVVVINETTGSSVTNIGTANADNADPVDDTANVTAVDRSDCVLNGSVTTTACPGTSVIDVVDGTLVTWCAEVCWDAEANSPLTTTVTLLDGVTPLATSSELVVAAGACGTTSFNETLGSDSVSRTLAASGSDGFGNAESCQAPASVNIHNPDITIEKMVSLDDTCGNGDDAESQEVYTGTDVWYCFRVANNHDGAENLINVEFSDPTLGLLTSIGALDAGGEWTSSHGPVTRTSDVSNTASVTGEGASTGTPVAASDSAVVTVVHADVIVDKSGTTSLDVVAGQSDISYTLFVWNNGTTAAVDVELSDPLPEAFVYASDDAGCSYVDNDAVPGGGSLDCVLGNIDPGMASGITITVLGTLADGFATGSFDNEACAYPDNTTTPDVDLANNCDSTTTRLTSGATRTIGFWGNHPDMMAACLDANGGLIEQLGFVELATVENAIGIIKTNIAHDLCKTKRDDLTKARLQAGRQVLAAFCNVTYLGAAEPEWMASAQATLEGEDIPAILELGGVADIFNNSGDDEPMPEGITFEHANPHFPWTDPTSPEECPTNLKGKGKSGSGSGGCSVGSGNSFDPLLPLLAIGSLLALCRRRRVGVKGDPLD